MPATVSPTRKKLGSPRKPRAKKPLPPAVMAQDVWQRTRLMVEVLLGVMEQGVTDPDSARDERWQQLFGSKDSAVVILQKLVKLLAELQELAADQTGMPAGRDEPLNTDERTMLSGWLKELNEANAAKVLADSARAAAARAGLSPDSALS